MKFDMESIDYTSPFFVIFLDYFNKIVIIFHALWICRYKFTALTVFGGSNHSFFVLIGDQLVNTLMFYRYRKATRQKNMW